MFLHRLASKSSTYYFASFSGVIYTKINYQIDIFKNTHFVFLKFVIWTYLGFRIQSLEFYPPSPFGCAAFFPSSLYTLFLSQIPLFSKKRLNCVIVSS